MARSPIPTFRDGATTSRHDPLGVRAGGFLIYPSVTVDGTYNNNVLATDNDEEDDYIFYLQTSDCGPFQLSAPQPRLDRGERHRIDTSITLMKTSRIMAPRLQVGWTSRATIAWTAAANVGREHDSRDDPEDSGADQTNKPVEYYVFGGALGFQQDFNRFNFGLLGTFDRRDYDEEDADQDEDERDRNRYGARLRYGLLHSRLESTPFSRAAIAGSSATPATRPSATTTSTAPRRHRDRLHRTAVWRDVCRMVATGVR